MRNNAFVKVQGLVLKRDFEGSAPMSKATQAMNAAPRCGVLTRSGNPCKGPAVGGRGRCRMHHGGKAKGAPRGNRNAWKHGGFSFVMRTYRAQLSQLRKTLRELSGG